jgi:cyanate permease
MAVGWATMSSAMVNILLAPWFERKRGLAVSLAMNGASLGGVVIAPGVLALVHVVGFQRGLAAATLTMLAMLVPLAVTVTRRRPEELGLAADGDEPEISRADQAARPAEAQDVDRRAPWRTLGYWTISIPFGLGLAAQVGFLMHEVAFLTPIVGVGQAGIALSITTLAAVVGRVLLGTVIDRMQARQAAALNFIVQIGGLTLLLWRPSLLVIYVGCAVVGLAVGNMTSLPGLLVQREFSGRQFASVVSLIVATNQVIYSFAPGIRGALRDATGSYTPALWLCITLDGLAAVVVLMRQRPRLAMSVGGRLAAPQPEG